MTLFILSLGLLALGGVFALLAGSNKHLASAIGSASSVVGSALSLVCAFQVVISGVPISFTIPWGLPGAALYLKIDPLSGFFLIPTLFVSGWAAVYGLEYLRPFMQRKSMGAMWFFYNTLIVSMMLVITAHNGIIFLLGWEIMSLASFFLVTFEHEKASARYAGWVYFVASHIGTAFILVMWILLWRESGTFNFDTISGKFGALDIGFPIFRTIFVLALIGFGTKAGFIPLHVWLPEAHPAAPSHVSAVMSGVMIKTGIYGLIRIIILLGHVQWWWGWVLVFVGLSSGILGVVFALSQHDLKRLLAYHSVENIGIIALGLGLGLLGISYGSPTLAVLGFGGGLLHVLNHALFKGLLFMSAGAVLQGTGTRNIDLLGGVTKKMPWTAAAFLVGSIAISGLPPLNGFISEFLMYFGLFKEVSVFGKGSLAIAGICAIGGLALIGGLASACFTKAFGIVFLGEPRSGHTSHAHEAGLAMKSAMFALVAGCAAIAIFPARVVILLGHILENVTALPAQSINENLTSVGSSLSRITLGALLFFAAAGLLALIRKALLSKRVVEKTVTWDCGYKYPTARMQYTASSFAQPLMDQFSTILRTKVKFEPPQGLFPVNKSSYTSETPDTFRDDFFKVAFKGIERLLAKLKKLQQGWVQLYILYIALALIAFLIWNLAFNK